MEYVIIFMVCFLFVIATGLGAMWVMMKVMNKEFKK